MEQDMRISRQDIEEQAAAFLQRRESGEWGEVDQMELAAWLGAATRNRVAFLRTEAAWEEMGRLKAVGAGFSRRSVPTADQLNTAFFSASPETKLESVPAALRHGLTARYSAIAASLLLIAGAALGSYELWFAGDRYVTPVGGVTSVPLPDGSHVTLNTHSEVRVVLSSTARHIRLSQGEAYFEVAPDKSRPFIVQVGNTRVIAVGTKFSVRREGEDVQVVVTEGKVRVENAAPGRASGDETGRPEILLTAGSSARAGERDIVVQQHTLPEAEEALSWRSGYVVFHETPLADAVAEFNRYNLSQIVIHDPSVAAMQLTGKFRATNNETFVKLLEEAFHIHSERVDQQIVLSPESGS